MSLMASANAHACLFSAPAARQHAGPAARAAAPAQPPGSSRQMSGGSRFRPRTAARRPSPALVRAMREAGDQRDPQSQQRRERLPPGMQLFYATCHPGLEAVVADELSSPTIGARDVLPGKAGVQFVGDLATGYRANLWLRSAIRVLSLLHETLLDPRRPAGEEVRSAPAAAVCCRCCCSLPAVVRAPLPHVLQVSFSSSAAGVRRFPRERRLGAPAGAGADVFGGGPRLELQQPVVVAAAVRAGQGRGVRRREGRARHQARAAGARTRRRPPSLCDRSDCWSGCGWFWLLLASAACCAAPACSSACLPCLPPPAASLPSIASAAAYQDRLAIYRDMSGASLHRRGYRQAMHRASLNEAAAGGILRMAGWHRLCRQEGAGACDGWPCFPRRCFFCAGAA